MSTLKIIFKNKDTKTEIKAKAINEDKLKYFLDELDKTFVTSKQDNFIKVYRGTRKIRDCFIEDGHSIILFNKWLDYKKVK